MCWKVSGTPTAASNTTTYNVTVTDAVGATANSSFALTVHAPAAISTQPVALSKNVGQAVLFTVVAIGNPAPTYQWKKGGADLPGKTDNTLGFSATLDDAGNYSVEVRNTTVNGATSMPNVVVSNSVALTVYQPPTISAQPQSQTVTVSAVSVNFSVTASGTPAPTYQWKKNGVDIAGATATTLTVTNLSLALSGSKYSVVVTNAAAGGVGGTVTSDEATLTVNPDAPVISSIPSTSFTGVQGSTLLYGPIAVNASAAPYTFSATGLPAGLTINSANGNISGTPTASTVGVTVRITVTNATGSDFRDVTFIIQPPVPSFSAAIIPTQATVATAYSFTLPGGSVQNATSFSATGLPPGLTINPSTGAITGTPTTAGVYTAQLTATNVTGSTPVSIVFNVVLPPGAPAYVGTLNPSGKVGVVFSFTPDFGTGTTTYAITGTLPGGLGFSTSTGAITGTPTAAGSFPISISATRSGITATAALTLTINPPDSAPVVVFPAAGNAISLTLNTPVSTTFASGYQLAANPVAGSGQTVTFAATGLPAGLSLSTSGALTGTPSVLGTFNAVVSATNSVTGKGPDATLRIFVDPSPLAPVISSAAAVLGRVNVPLTPSYQLTATPAATSFALVTTGLPAGISATLPAGLTLSGSTISGTPTVAGETHVLIAGINGSGTGAAQEIVFTILPPLTVPVVTSNGSASGNAGQAFSYQITATNSPTAFGVIGSLPAGLGFTAGTGLIFGVPTTPTATPIVVSLTATNGDGTSVPKSLSITIGAALATPVISNPGATVSGRVGVALAAYTITASETPTSFSAVGLPPGLVLAPATGVITGTPTQSGLFATQVSATNAAGTGAAATLNFAIAAAVEAPTIGGVAPPAGRVGVAFDYPVVATVPSGSPAVTSYALSGAGMLPVGLALNTSTGHILGTPAEAGLFTVAITATNSVGTSVPQPLVINIQPAANTPVITSPITATATVGVAFSYQITATNLTGSAPYAPPIALEAVGLPAGFAGNPATGVIQGTPATVGSFTITLVATNAAGTGVPRTLTLEVLPAPTAPVVNSPAAASAQVGATFSYQITATNSPTSFEVLGAPAWVAVGTASGTLSGVPVEPGAVNVALVASNSAGSSSPSPLAINVAASASAPVVNSSQTAGGTAGVPFTYQISATGSPTSFGASGLPAGVTVNTSNGVISGTPTVSGIYAVTIFARNSSGKSYPVTLTLTIAPSVPFSGN